MAMSRLSTEARADQLRQVRVEDTTTGDRSVASSSRMPHLKEAAAQIAGPRKLGKMVEAEGNAQRAPGVIGTTRMDAYRIRTEPYYRATGDEIALFEVAYCDRLPVMLKGPTGCGKTRFLEHMAWRLSRPLITVAAHEDLTAADLTGRYLLAAEGTV